MTPIETITLVLVVVTLIAVAHVASKWFKVIARKLSK